jgi:uncharacterized protein (UPF0332 family)
MTLDSENRNLLIQYRIEQSDQTVLEAEFLIGKDYYRGAVNRIYYSCFYILSALAIKYEFTTSKHNQLIGWFNKTFIATKILPKEISQFVLKAYNKRIKGDYEPVDNLNNEEVQALLGELKNFISEMKIFLSQV